MAQAETESLILFLKGGLGIKIVFSEHARFKFRILHQHGVNITEGQVRRAIESPDKVLIGHKGRKIAQTGLTQELVLRVIFEEKSGEAVVITFYPGRRERYED